MPQYELMYLLGSQVADTEVPAITEQVKQFVADNGGKDIVETQLGKKKLAYPIKKTRNGHYVVVNFSMDSRKVNVLDAKIRTQNTIIRHLLINLDEHLERGKKDKVAQSKLTHREPGMETDEAQANRKEEKVEKAAAEEAPVAKAPAKKKEAPILELDQEELDKKIEAALSEDLSK